MHLTNVEYRSSLGLHQTLSSKKLARGLERQLQGRAAYKLGGKVE